MMQTIYNLPPQWIRELTDEVAFLRGRYPIALSAI